MLPFEQKRILVTGGVGSLGKVLVKRLLKADLGRPRQIIVFSRDEAKQHDMRLAYMQKPAATDEVIYNNSREMLSFQVGDVRDIQRMTEVLRDVDIVFNAAALKQVPTCEYAPYEAVLTNVTGAENIVRAIQQHALPVELVVGISTDKACKPVNVMGMSKAIQERIFIQANLDNPATRFVCLRYGNVLASRGSVIPLFVEQIRNGGPLTVTTLDMTRFLMSLEHAVDTIFAAVIGAKPGETYVPKMPSARIVDLAQVLIGDRPIEIQYTGIRPGEKLHEILISEEEIWRTEQRGDYFAILPALPELRSAEPIQPAMDREYSSLEGVMTQDELRQFLSKHGLLDVQLPEGTELLR